MKPIAKLSPASSDRLRFEPGGDPDPDGEENATVGVPERRRRGKEDRRRLLMNAAARAAEAIVDEALTSVPTGLPPRARGPLPRRVK